ncbi:MAG TPA: hypothetical protein DIU37_01335 [Opitutae bacterium]|nr:hypothetical protein [Opitutae bacterium]|tara:strand:+ start:1233 stop:2039 length:807 start_codon:yes stop_codon:yes gene_type:complete
MFYLSPDAFIHFCQSQPIAVIWAVQLVFCFGCMLLFLRLFGAVGIYAYITVMIVAANLEVLKAVKLPFFDDPVALGTVVFSSIYLGTDILAEYYGPKIARKAVWLGFASYTLMIAIMMLALGLKPLTMAQAGSEWAWAVENHDHLMALFNPAPALLVAGMISYLFSQLYDVWIFHFLKCLTRNRWLWLRNNASTMMSALLDNIIFSILAWRILSEDPMPWPVLIFTYILGTYALRVIVALLDTPIIYLARYFLPEEDRILLEEEEASA